MPLMIYKEKGSQSAVISLLVEFIIPETLPSAEPVHHGNDRLLLTGTNPVAEVVVGPLHESSLDSYGTEVS